MKSPLPEGILQSLYRADFYRALSMALDFPTVDNVSSISEISEGLIESEATDIRLKPLFEIVKSHCALKFLPELEAEYFRIFTSGIDCPESEGSYYPVDRGTVVGDVCAFYEAFGLQSASKQGPPDSMKMELAFMSYMALKEGYATEQNDTENLDIVVDAEKKFLQAHLGRWGFIFSHRLLESSDNEFYKNISMILESFLESEIQKLQISPARVDNYMEPKTGDSLESQFDCAVGPMSGRIEVGALGDTGIHSEKL
mgnify:CR=1 FL=1